MQIKSDDQKALTEHNSRCRRCVDVFIKNYFYYYMLQHNFTAYEIISDNYINSPFSVPLCLCSCLVRRAGPDRQIVDTFTIHCKNLI